MPLVELENGSEKVKKKKKRKEKKKKKNSDQELVQSFELKSHPKNSFGQSICFCFNSESDWAKST